MFIDRGNSMRLTPSGVICYGTRGDGTPDGVRRARGSLGYKHRTPAECSASCCALALQTAIRSMLRDVLLLNAPRLIFWAFASTTFVRERVMMLVRT